MTNKVTIDGVEYTPFENLSDIQEGQKVIVLENSRHRRGDVCTVGDIGTETAVCLKLYGRTSYYNLAPYTEPKEETKANPEDCVELKPGMEVESEEFKDNMFKIKYYYVGPLKNGLHILEYRLNGVYKTCEVSSCTPVPKENNPRPKYKIGDKMFWDASGEAFIISTICQDGDEFHYDDLLEEDIRPATPEEIDKYFN